MKFSSTIRSLSVAAIGALALLCASGQASAQNIEGVKSIEGAGLPASSSVNVLQKVGLDQKLGAQLPLDAVFRDETGAQVKLGQYFHQRPVILTLVYYDCSMLCSEVMSGLVGSLNMLSFHVGRDFDIVTVSIDPSETPAQAAAKKETYVKRYWKHDADTVKGWHFLTGEQKDIDALAGAVGYRYAKVQGPDGKWNQFAHTSAIMVATPEGKLAQYFYGVEYPPRDLRLALVDSSHGKTGTLVDAVLLYCYHYDPSTGRYSATVIRVIRLGGVLTVLCLGTFMVVMFRRDLKSKSAGQRTGRT